MSFTGLLQHTVWIERPPAGGAVDAYGNPSGAFVRDATSTPAFVQTLLKGEVGDNTGRDTVVAQYTVYLDGSVTLDESCRLVWDRDTDLTLEVLGVHEEQAPGKTHHLRVLARRAS